MEYKVVSETNAYLGSALKAIEERVNELVKMGWKPLGGISIDKGDAYNSVRAVQAMIKE